MSDLSTKPYELREAFVASLDWWREAGVEEHVADAPGGWLSSSEEEAQPAAAVTEKQAPPAPLPEPKKAALSRFLAEESEGAHPGDPEQWPAELAPFQQWWLESEMLDPPGAYPRVAPRGAAEAPVMLVIDQPQAGDTEALLGGPGGTLAANMLRAMGFAPDAAYFASVLPRHNLRPEWNAVAKAGYGALLLHHIALASPKAIIACGSRVWSLLAHETAQEPAALTNIAIDSVSVPAFAVPDIATLLRNPAKRAQTWNRWLEWNHSLP